VCTLPLAGALPHDSPVENISPEGCPKQLSGNSDKTGGFRALEVLNNGLKSFGSGGDWRKRKRKRKTSMGLDLEQQELK